MNRTRVLASLVLAGAVVAALGGCGAVGARQDAAPPEGSEQSALKPYGAPSAAVTLTAQGPQGHIVYDLAHGEIFRPEDTTELGQSAVVGLMQESGYGVQVREERLTEGSLDGAAAYYLAGPMYAFTAEEKPVIDDYLERGGTVILTIHVPYPVLALPARWGLPVGTAVVVSPASKDPADPGVFVTDGIIEDPLTEGVDQISIYSGWPVSADPNTLKSAKIVVQTGPEALADTNNNQQFDAGDKQAPFGVVGVTTVGAGRVIVVGDDAVFANLGMRDADNAKLFENILKLIGTPKGA